MDNEFPTQAKASDYSLIIKTVAVSVISTLATLYLFYAFVPERWLYRELTSSTNSQLNSLPLNLTVPVENIPDMVELVSPAVVSVVISADVPILEQYYEEFNPFGGLFGQGFGFSVPQSRQVGTEKREIGGGTGFFVSADGYIVTNRHVVDATDVEYSIVTNDGDSYDVEVVAKDPALDIAILKVDVDEEFSFLSFGNSEEIRLGSTVIAIGNALAEFPNSVSVGVVSGLSRDITARDDSGAVEALEGVIQTDAAINRGNSGGPLLNTNGEVIGVNVAVAGNGENIGFALPSDSVSLVYQSVKEHGEILRPFLGIRYLQIDEVVAKENNLAVDYGVIILRGESRSELAVLPGSAADKAGLRENDIILEINGQKLDGQKTLTSLIRDYQVGETVTLKVLKAGEEEEIKVTLEKAPTE